jgi:hypothetical protein
MRNLTLAAAAMLMTSTLLACGSEDSPTAPAMPSLSVEEAGHNAADHFKFTEAVGFEVESPCNGEIIFFSGEGISQLTVVDTRENLDAGFSVHREYLARVTATGTGPTSGASYTINDIFRETFQSPSPPAPQVTFSAGGTFRVTSDEPGLSFVGHFGFHGLVTPDGEFKVTRDVGNLVCEA